MPEGGHMKGYSEVDHHRISRWSHVSDQDWGDWKWQIRNALRNVDDLAEVIELEDGEREAVEKTLHRFRMAVTPYYAALIDRAYKLDSIRLQAVPSIREMDGDVSDLADPLHEEAHQVAPGLTHRYPDRVLLLVTSVCAMYCRHCTRRRIVGQDDAHLHRDEVGQAIDYIRNHEEIRDVLISGGDPLTLSDDRLEEILTDLRSIGHVQIIRIGTRAPVVMPMRITDELTSMLRKFHPLYINTHFNHYSEITADSAAACARLADAGIPLGNQSVLLRDVNDCPRIFKKLNQELLRIRVKPYYIYQCDLTSGISHFRTSLAKGVEIIENLRGHTSGMAVPTFVVDAPGGGGKIPVMPDYLISQNDRRVILRNYEGVITSYTQPQNIFSECWCELCKENEYGPLDGPAKLLNGEKLYLEPADLRRTRKDVCDDRTE